MNHQLANRVMRMEHKAVMRVEWGMRTLIGTLDCDMKGTKEKIK